MKIAICIPHNHPQFEARFFTSVVDILTEFSSRVEHEVVVFTNGYGFIDSMRNRLVQRAIDEGIDLIMWMDSDMSYAPDTLSRLFNTLVENDAEAVTALTVRKEAPYLPHVYTNFNGSEFTMAGAFPLRDVFQVAGAGNGCLLIKTNIYKRYTESFKEPWFTLPVKNGMIEFGEDLRFFKRVQPIKMLCDPSVRPKHLKIDGYDIKDYIDYNQLSVDRDYNIIASDEQLEKICIHAMKLNGNYDEDSYMRTRQSPKSE